VSADEITFSGWTEVDSDVLNALLLTQEPGVSLCAIQELRGLSKLWARLRGKPWRWEISLPEAEISIEGNRAHFKARQS